MADGICKHCQRIVPVIPGFRIKPFGVRYNMYELIAHVSQSNVLAHLVCNEMPITVAETYADDVWDDDDLWTEILDG